MLQYITKGQFGIFFFFFFSFQFGILIVYEFAYPARLFHEGRGHIQFLKIVIYSGHSPTQNKVSYI